MDINVRSKMGCVRAKIGLTGQLDRRQLENYFKPCHCSRLLASAGWAALTVCGPLCFTLRMAAIYFLSSVVFASSKFLCVLDFIVRMPYMYGYER